MQRQYPRRRRGGLRDNKMGEKGATFPSSQHERMGPGVADTAESLQTPGGGRDGPCDAVSSVLASAVSVDSILMSAVTRLLDAAQAGDRRAAADLLPLVYDELRKLAAARMSS